MELVEIYSSGNCSSISAEPNKKLQRSVLKKCSDKLWANNAMCHAYERDTAHKRKEKTASESKWKSITEQGRYEGK
jgi:hypothetical protein